MEISIYLSAPMSSQHDLHDLFRNYFDDSVKLLCPQIIEESSVIPHIDLKYLKMADMIVCHMPEPSIGTTAEISYAKWFLPYIPIIGYNSISNVWLDYFLDCKCNDLPCIKKQVYILSHVIKKI